MSLGLAQVGFYDPRIILNLLRGPKTKNFSLINHLDTLTGPHNHFHIMFYKKNGEIMLLMDPGY
jgi:hypothetical protein